MIFKEMLRSLELKIQSSYESGVTVDEAEKLASEFLYAQIQVSTELSKSDLSSRMRKSGVKAIRAAIYSDICSKNDGKKPTESSLEHSINLNELVRSEQDDLDRSEVDRDELERYYTILLNAHIHYRSISRGKFE